MTPEEELIAVGERIGIPKARLQKELDKREHKAPYSDEYVAKHGLTAQQWAQKTHRMMTWEEMVEATRPDRRR